MNRWSPLRGIITAGLLLAVLPLVSWYTNVRYGLFTLFVPLAVFFTCAMPVPRIVRRVMFAVVTLYLAGTLLALGLIPAEYYQAFLAAEPRPSESIAGLMLLHAVTLFACLLALLAADPEPNAAYAALLSLLLVGYTILGNEALLGAAVLVAAAGLFRHAKGARQVSVFIIVAASVLSPVLHHLSDAGTGWLRDYEALDAVRSAARALGADKRLFPLYAGREVSGRGALWDEPVISDTVLFAVDGAPRGLNYYRMGSFDYYRDGLWHQSPVLTRGGFTPALSGAAPVTLTIASDFWKVLPHPLNLARIESAKGMTGSLGGSLVSGTPLVKGDTLSLIPLADGMVRYGDIALETRSDPLAPRGAYTQYPDYLRDALGPLPDTLAGADALETSLRILAHLKKGYVFDAGVAKVSGEFLPDFLRNSRRGHSVHFATAFTMLARMNGIRARIVSGFLFRSDGVHTAEVTMSCYHYWAEVWSDNRWYRIETVPGLIPGMEEGFAFAGSAATGAVRDAIEGRKTTRQVERDSGRSLRRAIQWLLPYPLALFGLWFILHGMALMMVLLRPQSPRQRILTQARRLARFTRRRIYSSPDTDGYLEWERRLGRFTGTDVTLFRRAAYAADEFTAGDAAESRRLARRVRKEITRRLRRSPARGYESDTDPDTGEVRRS